MQELLARLASLALGLATRFLVLAAIVGVLVIVYLLTIRIVRHVAARAAATPMPGEGELAEEERAIRNATRRRRLDTLVLVAVRLGRVTLVVLSGFCAVAVLAPEVIAALGSLGVALGVAVGGAIGFGAQQLVRDYLNGVLILGENPFSVGDVVALAGVRGTVEEVGLRRTIVRDNDGVVHSVPNGEIQVASNFTRTFARVNERFAVAAGTDIERATRVLNDVCAALAEADDWKGRFIEPPRVLRVDVAVAGDAGIPILVTAMVRPGEQWEIAGELRQRAPSLRSAQPGSTSRPVAPSSSHGALDLAPTRRTTLRAMPTTRDRKDAATVVPGSGPGRDVAARQPRGRPHLTSARGTGGRACPGACV